MIGENVTDISLKDVLTPRELPEEEKNIAGTRTKLASFSMGEYTSLIDLLDKLYYYNGYYTVKKAIAENFDLLVDAIRAVKSNTKQPFQGVFSKGNALAIKPLDVNDFTNVWGTNTNKTWSKDVTAGTAYDYLGTDTAEESTDEVNGFFFLGFIDKTPVPKVSKVQLKKNGESYIPQYLEWDAVTDEPFLPLPEPYVILPESSFHIKAGAEYDGTTELIPVGFRILQAKAVPSMF